MRLSKLDRRDFIEAMLLAGLTACAGRSRATRALRASPSGDPMTDPMTGPLYRKLAGVTDQLFAGAITPRDFLTRTGQHLMELELDPDVLADWEDRGPAVLGEGRNGYRLIHSRTLAFGDRGGTLQAVLFYTPAGVSNPPHEHHNLVSIKRVLKGSYHVREYERLRRAGPDAIAIRQTSEQPAVTFAGPCVEVADDHNAVHWFGARAEPVLALNLVVSNALEPRATFHGEARPTGRYFVDPTATPDRDGVIIARSVGDAEAAEFSRHRVDHFPSRLVARRG